MRMKKLRVRKSEEKKWGKCSRGFFVFFLFFVVCFLMCIFKLLAFRKLKTTIFFIK